jgi:predicted LPLAT superfamily acyltransferase
MSHAAAPAAWTTHAERGTVPLIRLAVWLVLRLPRWAMQALLTPVCLYFFVSSLNAGAASRTFLARALGRRPTALERWRHYRTFATCLLDRVLLLNGRVGLFDVRVHGEREISAIATTGAGGFLIGAHLGNFEVVRAAGHRFGVVRTALLMYEDNARKTNAVLNALNPRLAMQVIGLGRPGAMLAVKDRLEEGYLIGMLADRSLAGERCVDVDFLGAPARFPLGPFRMAAILRKPVLLMLGVYRGGRRYDIHFEVLAANPAEEPLEAVLRRYVARLEDHCRRAPFNWFNFYDFWA